VIWPRMDMDPANRFQDIIKKIRYLRSCGRCCCITMIHW
jgi:hypothetical protein